MYCPSAQWQLMASLFAISADRYALLFFPELRDFAFVSYVAATQHGQRRRFSSYMGNFNRKVEQLERDVNLDDKQASVLKELNKIDPESVIRWFESRPLSQHSPGALAEYVKALVKVDRLDESSLLRTLRRGVCFVWFCLFLLICIRPCLPSLDLSSVCVCVLCYRCLSLSDSFLPC